MAAPRDPADVDPAGPGAVRPGTRAAAAARDAELQGVLREITQVLEAGQRIDTQLYLSRYPRLAPGLKRFFDEHERGGGELSVGAVLDDYRITGVLGRGGMGVVYEAEQLSLKRTVALKVLPPALIQDTKALDRFRREASAVARLSHPRIVAVHGFQHGHGLAWLAMERVNGLDLAEVLDRLRAARTHGRRFVPVAGPALSRPEEAARPHDDEDSTVLDLRNYAHVVAAWAADACDALRHAHAHGVIHRDIKPSNLLLTEDGRIKVADFGLAKTGADGTLTHTGDFVGSPQYVSPEQASSRRVRIDERSDVYSLGVTLYELLTLHQPFHGKNVHVILRQILTKDPPPPSRLNPRVPRDLETIVMRAIEKEPDKRYAGAEAFGDDLRRFLNYEPILARPPSAPRRWARAALRHRVALAGVSMALAIVVLSSILLSGRDDGRSLDNMATRLASGPGSATPSEDALALLSGLGPGDGPAASLAVAAGVSQRLGTHLERGQLDAVAGLLAQVDARSRLGLWNALQRELFDVHLAEVRLGLVEAVAQRLTGSPARPDDERRLLGMVEGLLGDGDPRVVKAAAWTLGQLAAPSSLGALLDALHERDDVPGRLAIVGVLGRYGDDESVRHLVELTNAEAPELRYAALDALARLQPPGLDPLVGHLGRDDQGWIRHRYQLVTARRPGP